MDTLLLLASEADPTSNPNLQWLYILIPALFGGYGLSTMISHFTKRKTEAGQQRLEGTRLGQDIMEKAMLRLDKEVADLRARDDAHEQEREADRRAREHVMNINGALMRYVNKVVSSIRASGGTVPKVDPADEPYLQELSLMTRDNPTV